MADYDPNKITKLSNLKTFAEGLKEKVALAEELNALDQKVDALELGDKNVIEKVKVNGKDVEIKNKEVDIDVPEALSDLDNDEGFLDNAGVLALVNAEINKLLELETPENGKVDTIKELVDYVAQHAPEAAKFAADILKLQGLVGETAVSQQILTALEGYVTDDEIADFMTDSDVDDKIKDFVTNEALNKLLEGYVTSDGIKDFVTESAMNSKLANYVTQDDIDEFITEDALEGYAKSTDLEGYVAKENGKGLSTNDFDATYKAKLDAIEYASDSEVTSMLEEVFAVED